jgi:Carboxypeptidase regulatory-like domain/TonB dependent receptor-like, beta-barrel/TonB-dependent Receptor Plug Domain
MKPGLVLLFALACFCLSLGVAWSQDPTATILGIVTDSSGSVLPGVSITIKRVDTSQTRTMTSDQGGRYRLPLLSPGRYEVTAQLSGFQTVVRSGLTLTVGQEALVNIQMPIGNIAESVTVEAAAPLVETTTSSLSHVVNEQQLGALPLNGRDFSQLVLLQPGVVMSRSSVDGSNVGQGIKISVAGSRPSQNLFTLDGTAYNDALNNTPASANGVMTGVETIKEFRVVTNAMSAEYGRAGGGVFNVVTKSGTNQFFGSVFEFFRDDALDAKNFFDHEKPDFRRNQVGGSFGGPLVRNRTFFFSSYEGLREQKGITQVATVLDDDARRGILPGRAPIAIPATIQPYISLYPVANGPLIGDAAGNPTGLAEYRSVLNRQSDQDFGMIRVDHTFTGNSSVFGRYLYDDSVRDEPVNYAEWPNQTSNTKHVLTVEQRQILSANVINELRGGFNRSSPREDVVPVDPRTDLAFVPGEMFGELAVTGLTEIGTDRTNPKRFAQDLYQLTDQLFVVKGNHALKAGIDWQHFRYDGNSESRTRGRLRFRNVTDFLTGVTQQFEIAKPGSDFVRHYRQHLFGIWLQDDMKVLNDLTINAGVRYEFVTTPRERDGKVSNLRNLTDTTVTVGDPLFLNPTKTQFAPRLGVAWNVGGRGTTSIRAGFGIFYEEPLFYQYRSPIFRALPFVDRAVITRPTLPINLAAVGASGVPENEAIQYDLDRTYMTQYNVNVQQQLMWDSAVTVAYIGSRGTNLMGSGDVNIAVPQIVNGRQFFPAGSTRRNPAFGTIRMNLQGFHSEYNGVSVGWQKRERRGLQFQASYTFGHAMDNRSGSGGRQEFRNGQARTFDPYNIDLDWGRSDFDVRHTAVFNASYVLPFNGPRLAEGWQVSGVATLASGVPFSPIIPGDSDRDGSTDNVNRPDVIPGASTVPSGGRTPDRWYDPAAFAFPGAGYRGNAGRNILEGPGLVVVDFSLVKTQRLAGRTSLQVRFEVFNLLNRANFDIPFNDPDGQALFDESGARVPTAGKIFATSTDAREMQVAVRFLF